MIGALLDLHGAAAWLVDTLVATSLLCLLVLAVRRPVARHFGPQVAYALWLIPALRMVLPPLPQMLPSLGLVHPLAAHVAPSAPHALAADLVGGGALAAAPVLPEDLLPALGLLWLAGAAATLLWQGAVHRRLVRLLADAELVDRIGRVRLYQSDRIDGPVSFGLLAPVVILPDAHILPLSPAERALAVRHELAHHARGDLWANGCAVLLAALHWFNPLTRAAWRAFRFDQEAACDATVLSRAEQGSRGIYARALAKAASGHASAFASPMVRPDRLKDRLAMLAHPDPSTARRRLGLLAACVALLAGLAITATPVLADPPEAAPRPPAPLRVAGAVAVDSRQDGNGHVVRVRYADGSTQELRSDRALSQADVDALVAQANAARAEAHRDATEARREADQAWRESEQARAEAVRDAAQARTEALHEASLARTEALEEASRARDEALREARQARAEALAAAAEARRAVWYQDRQTVPPVPPTPPAAAAPPARPSAPATVTRIRLRAGARASEIILSTQVEGESAAIKPAVLMCDESADASPDGGIARCVDGDALQMQLISLRRARDAVAHGPSAAAGDSAARAQVLAGIARQIAALEAALRG